MRGVLIDNHQAILSLGDDIGVGHLPARNAQRMAGTFGDGLRGSLGAAHERGEVFTSEIAPRLAKLDRDSANPEKAGPENEARRL